MPKKLVQELADTLEEMLLSYEAETEIGGGWKQLNDKARRVLEKYRKALGVTDLSR